MPQHSLNSQSDSPLEGDGRTSRAGRMPLRHHLRGGVTLLLMVLLVGVFLVMPASTHAAATPDPQLSAPSALAAVGPIPSVEDLKNAFARGLILAAAQKFYVLATTS